MGNSIFIAPKVNNSMNASTSLFWLLGSGNAGTVTQFGAEASAQVPYRTAGRITKLSILVITNSRGTSTFRVRKNTANGSGSVSITASTTGTFTDGSGALDAVAPGDLICTEITTGAGGAAFNSTMTSTIFIPNIRSQTLSKLVSFNAGGTNYNVASTNNFNEPSGRFVIQPTEADVAYIVKTAGTLKNLGVQANTNTRSDATTVRTRVNGGNGACSVSIGAAATGLFEDTTNSDTLVGTETIDSETTTGGGTGGIMLSFISIELVSTNNKQTLCIAPNTTVNQNVTTFSYYGSTNIDATESNGQMAFLGNAVARNLQLFVSANSLNTIFTLKNRINTANGNLSISVSAAATGSFSDDTHYDAIGFNTLADLQLTAPAGSGAITTQFFGLVFEMPPSMNAFGCGI